MARRLRAMSPREVAMRTWYAVRQPLELARMRAGRYPRRSRAVANALRAWTGPARFYFERAQRAAPISPELRALADAACEGRRTVLGLGMLALPDPCWHVEPKAGGTWPRVPAAAVRAVAPATFDPRLTWELNRGHEWVVLARAYAATGEVRYRERLAAELASWRADNPVGIGINWLSAMEAAIRIHSLAWVGALLEPLPELAAMLHAHAEFVADHLSFGSSANNHLIVELSALIVAARVLGGVGRLPVLLRRARARLDEEVARQTFADGVNVEMATHYHAFVLEAVSLVARLERAYGEPSAMLEQAVARMAAYVDALRCDDGSLLERGDSDDGRILGIPPADALAALVAPPAGEPAPRSRVFADSGQLVLRSPGLLAVLDAGPFGFGALAAHAHCDCLALDVALGGRPAIVDRGTCVYNGDDAERDRFRMTAAHNTVQVGAREQADAAGPFLWSRKPTVTLERCELGDIDGAVASHDGFAPWTHRRSLVHRAGALIVVDEVAGEPTRATGRLHLAPGIEPTATAHQGGTLFALRAPEPIGWIWVGAPDVQRIETRHSPRYAATCPAWSLVWDLHGRTAFAVGAQAAPPDIAALAALARGRGIEVPP